MLHVTNLCPTASFESIKYTCSSALARSVIPLNGFVTKNVMYFRFLADIMDSPELIRNVALVGQLHHGKVGCVHM